MGHSSAQITPAHRPTPLVRSEAMADAWLASLQTVSTRHRTAFGNPTSDQLEQARRYFFAAERYDGRLC